MQRPVAHLFFLGLFGSPATGQECWSPLQVSDLPSVLEVATADLDGDGDEDLIATSTTGVGTQWHENLAGDGSLWAAHPVTPQTGAICLAADVDGDGDQDAVVRQSIGSLWWIENVDGVGSAWAQHGVLSDGDTALRVEAVDLDGDGDVDLVEVLTNAIRWQENAAGDGSVWLAQTVLGGFPQDASPADVDQDGDVDLYTASLGAAQAAWQENVTGDGAAWDQHFIAAPGTFAAEVEAADLDGDGDSDALFHAAIDPATSLLFWGENLHGDGTSWTSHILLGLGNQAFVLRAADVDADGDQDFLASSWGALRWGENASGDGSSWAEHEISATGIPALAAADLGGDARLEAVTGSPRTGDLLVFGLPSTAATELVRLGSPPNPAAFLPGVTSGPVLGATWDPMVDHTAFLPGAVLDFIAVTTLPANVFLPPWGTLLCDLTTGAPLLFLATPGSPFALPIPNHCGLLGASLCSQAASSTGLSVQLTNALDLTLGSF